MVLDAISVTVSVTTGSLVAVEAASVDVVVPGGVTPLKVEDADAESFDLPDPEPVTSPVAPAALMRE